MWKCDIGNQTFGSNWRKNCWELTKKCLEVIVENQYNLSSAPSKFLSSWPWNTKKQCKLCVLRKRVSGSFLTWRKTSKGTWWCKLDFAQDWTAVLEIVSGVMPRRFMKSLLVVGCQDSSSFSSSEICNLDYVMQELYVWTTCKLDHLENGVRLPDALSQGTQPDDGKEMQEN